MASEDARVSLVPISSTLEAASEQDAASIGVLRMREPGAALKPWRQLWWVRAGGANAFCAATSAFTAGAVIMLPVRAWVLSPMHQISWLLMDGLVVDAEAEEDAGCSWLSS